MIQIEFTCYRCGKSSEIVVDDIEEKTIVPVCDDCYGMFIVQKEKLIKSFTKRLKDIYKKYNIPVNTFKANEEFVELE